MTTIITYEKSKIISAKNMCHNSINIFSERMYKIQKSIDEACRIFQLRVVTDVLVQNSQGWLRNQMSVKTTVKKEVSSQNIKTFDSQTFIWKHWIVPKANTVSCLGNHLISLLLVSETYW